MSLGALRAATKEFDAEMIDPLAAGFKPLAPADKARSDRAIAAARKQRRAGRPVGTTLPPAAKARVGRVVEAAKAQQAKLGRPVVGQGAKTVLISIERGLLSEADAYAKRQRMTRSELIATGLRRVTKGARKSI